ncbi:MAG: polyhydroxyalkanoate synthesis protein PhaF [Actinobacteria bacterium]|nr:polyhydroxyalkanoate synthesis protein PhaF [Actinomycetota bacterium]MSW35988.1 polyhydroxyalkanoate synthesis protein PhaF [Actinomycetota bacterium]
MGALPGVLIYRSEVAVMLDALRGYVQLASGLTEVTLARAREAATSLLIQGLDLTKVADVPGKDSAVDAAKVAAGQVQGLADELLESSKQNRELLVGLVRTEVDRAAGRLGFVREEELAAVRRHVSRLETQLAEIRSQMSATSTPSSPATSTDEPAKKKKKAPVAKRAASASAKPRGSSEGALT